MSNRRRLDRERLEVYLLTVLLAHRPKLLLAGLILLIYAGVVLPLSLPMGSIALLPAALLILLACSYQAALYVARAGAWVATIWKGQD